MSIPVGDDPYNSNRSVLLSAPVENSTKFFAGLETPMKNNYLKTPEIKFSFGSDSKIDLRKSAEHLTIPSETKLMDIKKRLQGEIALSKQI